MFFNGENKEKERKNPLGSGVFESTQKLFHLKVWKIIKVSNLRR